MSATSTRIRHRTSGFLAAIGVAGLCAAALVARAAPFVPLADGPAFRVANINPFPDPDAGSGPRSFTRVGDRTYFLASSRDSEAGVDLWITDGTANGTHLVERYSEISEAGLVAVDDALYLSGIDARGYVGLWRADASGNPPELFEIDFAGWIGGGLGGVLFETSAGLRLTSGEVASTVDVIAGAIDCFAPAIDMGGFVIFGDRDGYRRTDGTEAGTFRLEGPGRADCGDRPGAAAIGRVLYFLGYDEATGVELWRSDGTTEGTYLVRDIRPGPESGFVQPLDADTHLHAFTVAGDDLYFIADDGVTGLELWRTDGTEAGTRLVRDIVPGPEGLFLFEDGDRVHPSGLEARAYGSSLLFTAPDETFTRRQLWISDGTPEGTLPLDTDIGPFAVAGDRVYFAREEGSEIGAAGLWVRDLVTDEVEFLGLVGPVGEIAAAGESAVAAASDGILGVEPWWTDGSPGGTILLADIVARESGSHPAGLVDLGGTLLFRADDGVHGTELWRSDGTAEGTVLVRDIRPGGRGSTHPTPDGGAVIPEQRLVGGQLYFAADDGAHGRELWRSDGTESGTILVADITPGEESSNPLPLAGLDGRLFFFTDRDGMRDLWLTAGTAAGTHLVRSFRSPVPVVPGGAEQAIALDGFLLFAAREGEAGTALWRSDGTAAGTVLVADQWPGPADWSATVRMVRLRELALIAVPGDNRGLWRSDGTAAGTFALGGTFPSAPVGFGDQVYFSALGARVGLWRTDGTVEGTRPTFDAALDLVAIGPALFGTGIAGGMRRFWRLDQGDLSVADPSNALFAGLTGIDGRPILARFENPDVSEIWTTNGTAAGTRAVQSLPGLNLEPGFVASGGRVFFRADDGTGVELWALATEELDQVCTDECPPPPTPAPTPQPGACESECVQIEVGSARAAAGDEVEIEVTLRARGYDVYGAQNDLVLGTGTTIPELDGAPDCTVNPAIGRDSTLFSFVTIACASGEQCQGVRAFVLPILIGRPIEDGSVLYTCRVRVAAGAAAGRYPIPAESVDVAADGPNLPVRATGRAGGITVVGAGGGCRAGGGSGAAAWPVVLVLLGGTLPKKVVRLLRG